MKKTFRIEATRYENQKYQLIRLLTIFKIDMIFVKKRHSPLRSTGARIVAGGVIALEAMIHLKAGQLTASERGVHYGLLFSAADEPSAPH
jgi:hypothetical protein